jgi:hypothetical protein
LAALIYGGGTVGAGADPIKISFTTPARIQYAIGAAAVLRVPLGDGVSNFIDSACLIHMGFFYSKPQP